MTEKKADASKLVTNKELEMIIKELVIYKDNNRCIRHTKSFEKPIKNKYNL